MIFPSPQTRLLSETEIEKIRGILEETSKDSFGIPATQGEIEHYEDNKERLLGMLPALLADREELVRLLVRAYDALQISGRYLHGESSDDDELNKFDAAVAALSPFQSHDS